MRTSLEEFAAAGLIELLKSKPGGPKMPIRVIASTDEPDFNGEIVDQDGIDWAYFKEHGHFNDEHGKGAGEGVGVPTRVERIALPNGHKASVVYGYLIPESKRAREIWDYAQGLKKLGNPRRIGSSVQGKILAREGPKVIPWKHPETGVTHMLGNRITKSTIQDLTLTRHPTNASTIMETLAKSLGDNDIEKALTAGEQVPASGGGAGAPLLRQSTDASVAVVAPRGRKSMKRCKKEAWAALDKDAQDTLSKAGYGPEEDAEEEQDLSEDDAEEAKKLEKSLADAIDMVRGAVSLGKGAVLVTYDMGEESTGRADAIRRLLDDSGEARGDLIKSLGFNEGSDELGSLDLEPTNDLVKSLTARVETYEAQTADALDRIKTLTATVDGHFATMTAMLEKSLKIPAMPRAVDKTGTVLVPDLGADSDVLTATEEGYHALNKSLRTMAARGDTPEDLRKSIIDVQAFMASTMPGRRPPITRKFLKEKGIELPAG